MTPAPHDHGRRSWVQRLLLATNGFLILVALSVAAVLYYGYSQASTISRVTLDRSLTPVADTDAGTRVVNILLVGSDSSAGLDADDPIQIDRQGEKFGDVIIIAHLDERNGQVALLSLPRDLWVTMADSGVERRINRSFLDGGAAGLIDTIEHNFEIPIHHYVNVDFAGFQGLVGAVGSVEVYFDTPARDWDTTAKPVPRSRTGFAVETPGCHALDPEQALAYVRSRYYQTLDADGRWVTDPTSDLGRIRRQQDFLRRLIQTAIDQGARNPFVLKELVETGLDHVVVDGELTGQLLVDLGSTYRSFDPELLQTYSVPAADARIGTDQVLVPVNADLEPVLALFRGAPPTAPETIRIRLLAADDEVWGTERGERVAGVLGQAGFATEQGSADEAPVGVLVRHGPDGAQAAAVVADHLAAADGGRRPRLAQVPGLAGRTIVVVVGDGATPDDADGVATPTPGSGGGEISPQRTESDSEATSVDPERVSERAESPTPVRGCQ